MPRLQADAELVGRLAADSFEGPGWDRFVDVLVEYGCAALRRRSSSDGCLWAGGGRCLRRRCRCHGIGRQLPECGPLHRRR